MRVKWNNVSKELSPGPDTLINAQPIISIVLANIYWASAKSYLIWMTSSCPPPSKPRRQALWWSHFTDEEVKISDWVKAWTLVIIIICPLATPEQVMVTQQLNKNVSVDRQQLLRLALFRRWKVNKYHIWQKYIFFSSNMLAFYWGIIYIQRNAPMLSLVLNSDKGIQPYNHHYDLGNDWFAFCLYSFAFSRTSYKWIIYFFHWTCFWDSPVFLSILVIPSFILLCDSPS